MSVLKNLKFLAVVGAAVGFLGVTVTSLAASLAAPLAGKPIVKYVAVNVVNDNPDTTKVLAVADTWFGESSVVGSGEGTLVNKPTLKYRQSAFAKYESPNRYDNNNPFRFFVTLAEAGSKCMVIVLVDNSGTSIFKSSEGFCNTLNVSKSTTDNTSTVTINYKGA